MNTFVKSVLAQLIPIEPEEMPFVVKAIENCERKGWTVMETYRKVRWLEHVDPTIPEDVALYWMRRADEYVELRLVGKQV